MKYMIQNCSLDIHSTLKAKYAPRKTQITSCYVYSLMSITYNCMRLSYYWEVEFSVCHGLINYVLHEEIPVLNQKHDSCFPFANRIIVPYEKRPFRFGFSVESIFLSYSFFKTAVMACQWMYTLIFLRNGYIYFELR